MRALFIILRETEYLEEILERFLQLGIKGATILESEGMAQALLGKKELLKFSPFMNMSEEDQHRNSKTIVSVLDAEQIKYVVKEVRDVTKDCKKDAIGFMFSMPVDGVFLLKPQKN